MHKELLQLIEKYLTLSNDMKLDGDETVLFLQLCRIVEEYEIKKYPLGRDNEKK